VAEPASHVPTSVSWVVVTPVVFVVILALRLAPIHAIQAQPVQIPSGSSTSFFDNIVEALVTARKRRSGRGGRRRVLELWEPRNDVVHAATPEDVLERPGADFHEFVLVVKVSFFSASALLMVEAQAYIPKLAVQHGLEMATGGIGRPCHSESESTVTRRGYCLPTKAQVLGGFRGALWGSSRRCGPSNCKQAISLPS